MCVVVACAWWWYVRDGGVCVMVVVFLSFASFRFLFLFFKELEGKKE